MRKKILYVLCALFLFISFQNVSAMNQVTCLYEGDYELTFIISGDEIELKSDDYIFLKRGNYPKNERECPSSIDVDGSVIAWVAEGKGEHKLQKNKGVEKIGRTPCSLFSRKNSCEESGSRANVACLWNEKEVGGKTYKYCNVDDLLYVSCGDARDIPIQVPALISFFVNFLKIVTPIILIFIGIITLVKALAASKEDEIKKAQGSLIKKMIAAAMVFLVITIVQFVVSLVADSEYESDNGETEKKNLSSCLECFLDNDCEKTAYYKTNIAGQDYCTDLNNGNQKLCVEEEAE